MRLWQPLMPDQSRSDLDITQTAASEIFYSRALSRIGVFMPVISLAVTAAAWLRFGWRSAVGLVFGCAIAYINFVWLKRVIAGFVDRATGSGTKQSGEGIVFRFLLRYVLMAVGAYVILTVSPASLHGLLAGLFLPVAAILCEAVYEAYAALVRGI
jgi:small-conductance mechanosensitive channel